MDLQGDTMDRHWLASYPPGVPHDIDVGQYHSLTDLLEESFRKNKDRPFSVCMDQWATYGQVDQMSAALGAFLDCM
jgi:acyl-CoA synthetase (AMP-forming)/AMP-acid ligase II